MWHGYLVEVELAAPVLVDLGHHLLELVVGRRLAHALGEQCLAMTTQGFPEEVAQTNATAAGWLNNAIGSGPFLPPPRGRRRTSEEQCGGTDDAQSPS